MLKRSVSAAAHTCHWLLHLNWVLSARTQKNLLFHNTSKFHTIQVMIFSSEKLSRRNGQVVAYKRIKSPMETTAHSFSKE